jgi:hypothetical protein
MFYDNFIFCGGDVGGASASAVSYLTRNDPPAIETNKTNIKIPPHFPLAESVSKMF